MIVRTTCPSSNSTRSMSHVIQALSSINERKSKGGRKGKGKGEAAQGRGGEGRGRAAAGHGKGAIAVYLEDDQLWSLDGAYVASTAAAVDDHTEDDEKAHTALARDADAASNSNSYMYDDGDGWLDEFDDTESVSNDTANIATATSSIEDDENNSESSFGTDGNNSDSSTDYAQVVNYDDCESESELDEDERRQSKPHAQL